MKPLAGTLLLGVILSACAKIEAPPGGPEDRVPPVLLGTTPDSLASLPGFDDEVEFRFDEVVSEGAQPNFGTGTGDLEKLVLLSPSELVPSVKWRRDRITVKPREGWRANTVYRVELLPGVVDLERTSWREGVVVTFTTGEQLPNDTLIGRVIDWSNRRPVANALVEAVLEPDSLVYRTRADSSGRFRFGPLPRGSYLVYGVIDQNRNFRTNPRESFDSVRFVTGQDSVVGELWAFVHDSTPPRLRSAQHRDSLSVTLGFSMPLDPAQQLEADSVRVVLLPDSIPVPVEAILPRAIFDSVYRRPPARDTAPADSAAMARAAETDSIMRADSLARAQRAARDSAAAEAAARRAGRPIVRDTVDKALVLTRPELFDQLVLRLGELLVPGARYFIEIRGVRSVSGVEGVAGIGLAVPEAAAADSTARDTTQAAPADTTRPTLDTIPPPRRARRR